MACLVACPTSKSAQPTRTGNSAVKVHSRRVGRKSVSQPGTSLYIIYININYSILSKWTFD